MTTEGPNAESRPVVPPPPVEVPAVVVPPPVAVAPPVVVPPPVVPKSRPKSLQPLDPGPKDLFIKAARISPPLLDFRSIQVHTQSVSEVTITNTGTAPVDIHQAYIAGDSGDFSIGDDHCSNTTLQPAVTCVIPVQFNPGIAAPRTAAIQVPSNAGQFAANLNGTGTPPPVPIANLTPNPLDLTRLDIRSAVVLSNQGDGNLVTGAIVLGGQNPGDFALVSRECMNTTLFPKQACTIQLVFLADVAKKAKHKVSKAILTVLDNAAGSPHSVSLTGTESSNDHLTPGKLFNFGARVLETYVDSRGTAQAPKAAPQTATPAAKPPVTETSKPPLVTDAPLKRPNQ